MSLVSNRPIGKVIHQMWLDKHVDNNKQAPEKYMTKEYVLSVKEKNPDYTYVFWNMAMVKELFELPELQRWKDFFFNTLTQHIEKCDFARYAIKYIYTGIYLDLDFTCHRSFDCVIENRSMALVEDFSMFPLYNNETPIFNGFLASCEGHEFWPRLMDFIVYCYPESDGTVFQSTGPIRIGKLAKSLGIFDQPKLYDHYFIDRCYIIPGGMFVKKGKCSNIQPVTSTKWTEGTGWYTNNFGSFTKQLVHEWHVVIICILCLILMFVILKRFLPPIYILNNNSK